MLSTVLYTVTVVRTHTDDYFIHTSTHLTRASAIKKVIKEIKVDFNDFDLMIIPNLDQHLSESFIQLMREMPYIELIGHVEKYGSQQMRQEFQILNVIITAFLTQYFKLNSSLMSLSMPPTKYKIKMIKIQV